MVRWSKRPLPARLLPPGADDRWRPCDELGTGRRRLVRIRMGRPIDHLGIPRAPQQARSGPHHPPHEEPARCDRRAVATPGAGELVVYTLPPGQSTGAFSLFGLAAG